MSQICGGGYSEVFLSEKEPGRHVWDVPITKHQKNINVHARLVLSLEHKE